VLDRCSGDRGRFLDLLALEGEALIAAIGGRRSQELHRQLRDMLSGELPVAADARSLCRHDPRYPAALHEPNAPRMLYLTCGPARLQLLTTAPVVAIAGAGRCSDYGAEVSRSLARGLAAAGVTVAAGLGDRLSRAAHEGVLEAQGASIAVATCGSDRAFSARSRVLLAGVRLRGCVLSELPRDYPSRRWTVQAAHRVLGELAGVLVVVEAQESPRDLALCGVARARGRTVAAVPGRVTSPLSAGSHRLLLDGASLVRGPGDVLELLSAASGSDAGAGCDRAGPGAAGRALPPDRLDRRLRSVLEAVGAGDGTPEEVSRGGVSAGQALLALSELELLGMVVRGAGGRYLPRL